ncbi:hypothetical protein HYH02_006297 [Chlamydomonas schloesseri]|uniref:diacylglycerol O-acyltransferase n=1 Tax=Chlamydomonas schloesseri TaxID=2026947 RepID=A0A835WJ54_9CHLO|nr:hypothetical protein HYH02_006297 [Chlamydomonas schloesseri]|eukprot:KAG2448405.1 hypothetical protein HYH02_006297 [Chlamydomonas schloesseri]
MVNIPLPFFGGRRRPSARTSALEEPAADKQELIRLQKEVETLRIANEQLKEQLAARSIRLGEYLYKWSAGGLPLLGALGLGGPAAEWGLRYVLLRGTDLAAYGSAKDTAFSPRDEISVLSCFVAWEGLRAGRFWAFSVLDSGGSLLVRLAALNRDAAERWLAALEAAGCVREDSLMPPEGPKGSVEARIRSAAAGALVRSWSAPAPPPPPQPDAAGGLSTSPPPSSGCGGSADVLAAPLSDTAVPRAASASAGAPASAAASAAGAAGGRGRKDQRQGGGAAGAGGGGGRRGGAANGGAATAEPSSPAAAAAGAAGGGGGAAAERSAGSGGVSSTPPPPRRSLGGRPLGGAAGGGAAAGAGAHGAGGPKGPERGPMLGSSPVHTSCRFSLLSSERAWHEKHTGLYNLAFIILVLSNFRLALENALKYGWRLNPVRVVGDLMTGRSGSLGSGGGYLNLPLVACYPLLLAAALLSLGTELTGYALLGQEDKLRQQLSKRSGLSAAAVERAVGLRARAHEWLLFLVHLTTTTGVIALPWAVISLTKAEPVSGAILITLAVVLWMKLVSYHHCCFDLRAARRSGEVRPGERGCPDTPATEWGPLERYPENLTFKNLMYFLAVPTLSYQVNFPRARSVRWRWLLRRCAELCITFTALAIMVGQYITPAVDNSLVPLQKLDLPRVAERVLKLALPSTYAWLLGFYCLFHLWLNVLAELTRFGDREFYKDWWNAATVGEYWKLWNMPVHKWLLRHVYFPAIRAGSSRFNAILLTFFVSAVFHELLLGVPLHMVRLWAFGGIMFQVPLIMVTEMLRKKLNRDELGNYIFWIAFCVVGQPVCVLLYYHDYVVGIRPALLTLRQAAAAVGGAAAAVGEAAAAAAAAGAGVAGTMAAGVGAAAAAALGGVLGDGAVGAAGAAAGASIAAAVGNCTLDAASCGVS